MVAVESNTTGRNTYTFLVGGGISVDNSVSGRGEENHIRNKSEQGLLCFVVTVEEVWHVLEDDV